MIQKINHLVATAVTTNASKEILSDEDKRSLNRLLSQLSDLHDHIYVVGPTNMDYSQYHAIGLKNIITLDNKYFGSLSRYNRMMLSLDFYKRFENYEYVLIHHPDAYLFESNIREWCEKGFDNIGAPWRLYRPERKTAAFYKYILRNPVLGLKIAAKTLLTRKDYTGNGGLCLRKTATFIDFLKSYKYYADTWKKNEDVFFALIAPVIDKNFTVAPVEVAAHFSMETDPDYFFQMTDGRLPFGCHGWTKYHNEFWIQKMNDI